MSLTAHICSSKYIKLQTSHCVIHENGCPSVYFSIRHVETRSGLVLQLLAKFIYIHTSVALLAVFQKIHFSLMNTNFVF
jgi:hypothetical protein